MTTINQLAADTRLRRESAQRQVAASTQAARAVLEAVQSAGRRNLTAAEDARLQGLVRDRDLARIELEQLDTELADINVARADEADIQLRSAQQFPSGAPAQPRRTAALSVGRNERVYRKDTDPHGRQFLLDVTRNFLSNDPTASERLARHMAEERVERPGYTERAAGDTTTSNWAGLTVPAYLVNLYAPQIAALRPFADLCCVPADLPPNGMSVNFSKVTTGTSVGLQATELTGVSATSIDDTLGTASVQTAAGQQNISRQAIDRGTGIENVTMQDLLRKYATTLDSTLITQATTGLSAVAQTVTYTSGAPTGVEMWPLLYQAGSKLEAALLGVSYPSHVVMHSRRWNWLASQVSSSWPLMNSQGVNAQGWGFQLTTEYGPQVRAVLASGLKVVVDNNIATNLGVGTNQDEVYVVASTESMYLAEDPNAPVYVRAEQPNLASLGVLIVVYGYFAYFTRYANPASKLSGTGLVAPAGF